MVRVRMRSPGLNRPAASGPGSAMAAAGQDVLLGEQGLHRGEPAFVVRGMQVLARRHALDRVAELVGVEQSLAAEHPAERVHPRLPVGMERRRVLSLLALVASAGNRAEPFGAPKVADPSHEPILSALFHDGLGDRSAPHSPAYAYPCQRFACALTSTTHESWPPWIATPS